MRRLSATLPLLLLTACGSPEKAPDPAPSPTPTMAAPRTLVASDFDPATLGAKVDGPQGTEVESIFRGAGGELARMTSFVACPSGTAICDPDKPGSDPIFTYVHRVTLAAEEAAPQPSPGTSEGAGVTPARPEIGTTLFRTERPAAGFNLSVGYDKAEAEAALGGKDAIAVTLDQDQLIWRATKGSGWKPGATITFWWQSTLPPERLENAYTLLVNGQEAMTLAPFPAAPKKP